MQINTKRLEVFQKMLAIVLYLHHNSDEDITKVFGTADNMMVTVSGRHSYDGNDLMYVSEFDTVDKITTRGVKEIWSSHIAGSLMFFSDTYAGLHASCYYMPSLHEPCMKYTRDIKTTTSFFGDKIPNKHPLLINSSAVLESYFQNSTVQGEDEQYFSVWEHFIRSYCEQNNLLDLHFYSTGKIQSICKLYDLIPCCEWKRSTMYHLWEYIEMYGDLIE